MTKFLRLDWKSPRILRCFSLYRILHYYWIQEATDSWWFSSFHDFFFKFQFFVNFFSHLNEIWVFAHSFSDIFWFCEKMLFVLYQPCKASGLCYFKEDYRRHVTPRLQREDLLLLRPLAATKTIHICAGHCAQISP